MSVLTSGEFWAFVGVVAGIYTILTLGLQIEFGYAGLLNFGHVAFMAIGSYTMAILVVKSGWSMWLAAPAAVLASAAAGLLLGLATLRLRADYFAIVTIALSEIVRYVATNEDRLTGGSQGTINLAGAEEASDYNGQWQRFQDWFQGALHLGSKDVAMLVLVWAVALVLTALASLESVTELVPAPGLMVVALALPESDTVSLPSPPRIVPALAVPDRLI